MYVRLYVCLYVCMYVCNVKHNDLAGAKVALKCMSVLAMVPCEECTREGKF